MTRVNWIVTQIGSREHYAVPRAFHRKGRLERFYTDIWSARTQAFAKYLPRGGSLAHRFHADLPADRVTAFNFRGFHWAARSLWLAGAGSVGGRYADAAWIGSQFANQVNRSLARTSIDPATTAAFLFSTGALETCEYLKRLGVPIIVDQLDPARVDEWMLQAEIERWPDWEESPSKVPELYYSRLSDEWRLADLILVNSGWSHSALLKQGVEARKIIVVPLCYEADSAPPNEPSLRGSAMRPLTVLWLGQVVLRKGIPYLFEAAAKLLNSNVRFIVAGRVGISEKGVRYAPTNVQVLGYVARREAKRHFSEADVFVLPTISDGFALTQLEAMSFGLPVIATPNCGEVVTHGVNGLIVPPRDSEALADAIALLEANRQMVREMSARALETARQHRFSLAGYAEAVVGGLRRLQDDPLRPLS
jgi:glycosyltransferase involved in cell wall biosynthesis